MKKFKKYILLIMALNMCFFAYESEKREAEAFAMSTAALIVGGMALVGAGGVILSRTGTEKLGQEVITLFESAGSKIADIFSYNSVTDIGNLVVNAGLKLSMSSALGKFKDEAISYSSSEYYGTASATKVGLGSTTLKSTVIANAGDRIYMSFDYTSSGNLQSGTITPSYVKNTSNNPLQTGVRVNLSESASGHYTGVVVAGAQVINSIVSLQAYSTANMEVTISNLEVKNLGVTETPAYKESAQYKPISSDPAIRQQTLENNLTKTQYPVSVSNVQENVSSVSQIESTVQDINDTVLGTNTLISRMFTALGNIPSAIKSEMSNLWADAGAIWSGMNDTLINIKTDVGAKIGAMSDTMTGGIDNIRTDIGAMMENLRSGIDAVGANVAGWGQLTLEGIEAGVSSISTALTDTWTKITAKITEGVGTITDGIGKLTDGLTGVIEWIIGFPAMLFSVFVPPDFAFVDPLMNELQVDFDSKFSQFDALDQIFQNMFGATKSIYDIQVTFFGRQYYIVPILYKPTIDSFRPFMTGLLDLYVVTLLYRRYKGDTVIPL